MIGIFVFIVEQDRPVSKLERMDSQRTASAMSSDSQASGKDKKEKKKKDTVKYRNSKQPLPKLVTIELNGDVGCGV